jgi:prepilin signal peptidase PulO-like enzyme (type II secretory pathway)
MDLIPVLSYISTLGRCRYCKTRISIQYPIVELFTALIFGLIAWRFWSDLGLLPVVFLCATCADLFAIIVYDILHKIIPDPLVYIFIVLSVICYFFLSGALFNWAGPILFIFFGGLWWLSDGRWMGFGDAKLVLGIGFLLGPEIAFTAMLLAFWSGALVGIIGLLLMRGSLTMKSEIPFAPFLILATLSQLFFPIQFNIL